LTWSNISQLFININKIQIFPEKRYPNSGSITLAMQTIIKFSRTEMIPDYF